MIALWTSLVSLLCVLAYVLLRPPAVISRHNRDGTETRMVRAGQLEQADAVQSRLLQSIECPNYEIVATGNDADPSQQPADLYWVRYRCLPSP